MPRKRKREEPKTTAQRLSSIIKSSRDIMRKDKGLSGDLDRLPMLTWIMFLKFLDDMEKIRETEAKLKGEKFTPAIESPYRWRDWAVQEEGITGDELISFINNDEAVRPNGTRGPGLFAYLRSLQGEVGGDRRDVIADVFRETYNRMINGYLLRDIINKVNEINFTSSEEIHTLSFFYETMLREMRDAAGDAGEFYTPRPVIKFIVNVIDPKLGETILDPAAGTCGFLVESFEHLKKQCKTTEDIETLQKKSIFGGEAKPLPYLLGQMNMLLHGIEYPQIDYGNSLRFPLREIGDKDRVDIILTNPPFGGEEERGILSNFPADKQTAETALLFLQLIMRKLRRKIVDRKGGRCGMVVPDGVLFGDGVCARIKEELLKTYNLHTIVRLPKGVFAPYTDIKTNLLFFERNFPTEEIWYYEHPLPLERQKLKNPCYTKSNPLRYEEFKPLIQWWDNRQDNEQAWKVPLKNIVINNYNLDLKHPEQEKKITKSPKILIDNIIEKEKSLQEIAKEIKERLMIDTNKELVLERVSLRKFARHVRREVTIEPTETYRTLGCHLYGEGVYQRETKMGIEIKAKKMFVVKENDLVINRIWAQKGSAGIVPAEISGSVVTQDFPTYELDNTKVLPSYIAWYVKTNDFQEECRRHSHGTSGRQRLSPEELPNITFPLCGLQMQKHIISQIEKVNELKMLQDDLWKEVEELIASVLNRAFMGEL